MHQLKREAQRRLEADDSIRGMSELLRALAVKLRHRMSWAGVSAELRHPLGIWSVRSMVSRDHIDSPVANRGDQFVDRAVTPQRRIHLCIGSPDHRRTFIQGKMMRRNFAGDLCAVPPSGANEIKRLGRRHVAHMDRSARTNRNGEIAAYTLRLRRIRIAADAEMLRHSAG